MIHVDAKRPQPHVIPSTAPYWAAAAEDRLELPRRGGTAWEPYPRPGTGADYDWAETSTTGTVYTFSIMQFSPYDDLPAPFVVGLVQLDDGPRVMTNIVEIEPNEVTIGMKVEFTFIDLGDNRLPVFRPAT
ncbi:OB-fold domain-containing protein [Rhodococcus sp. KBS0724]|uniref:Zn-ribbon domain-containing OB-fold protein n=1 Tax=Rhodococcus sp. KBS0724 TaxID=1179674 RepID=UPI00110D5D44|nr:OB-fold domain-containing protein [Rhodococcus sp. KBS0724]TSD40417.1 OB-fold domain-containing protein [Rhodococcus sp. KBS0724]